MDFDFDLPVVSADDAREIEVTANGKSYGIFHVRHQFVNSPKWLLEFKRGTAKLSKRERTRFDDPQTEEDIVFRRSVVIRMFVDNYVVKSSGIPIKAGEWKHSTDNLVKYLCQPQAYFVFQELDEFASELSNFQSKAVADAQKK